MARNLKRRNLRKSTNTLREMPRIGWTYRNRIMKVKGRIYNIILVGTWNNGCSLQILAALFSFRLSVLMFFLSHWPAMLCRVAPSTVRSNINKKVPSFSFAPVSFQFFHMKLQILIPFHCSLLSYSFEFPYSVLFLALMTFVHFFPSLCKRFRRFCQRCSVLWLSYVLWRSRKTVTIKKRRSLWQHQEQRLL